MNRLISIVSGQGEWPSWVLGIVTSLDARSVVFLTVDMSGRGDCVKTEWIDSFNFRQIHLASWHGLYKRLDHVSFLIAIEISYCWSKCMVVISSCALNE